MPLSILLDQIHHHFDGLIKHYSQAYDELTITLEPQDLKNVCLILRDQAEFKFEQLMDVTAVDYLYYAESEWETEKSTAQGFDRAVNRFSHEIKREESELKEKWAKLSSEHSPYFPPQTQRFSVVYHLLSLSHNQRLRLKVFLDEAHLDIPSLIDIWPSANWFEREVFDLFGIYFSGHTDLRRILTDYGFLGHPFRKDFPLSGYVEVRYDAEKGQVIYEPVEIEKRVLVPKVIRRDEDYA